MDFTECYGDTVSGVSAAARSGDRKALRALVASGCSVDCRDNRGWNPLHEAAAAGSGGCVRELLSAAAGAASATRSYVNSLTHEGESACFLAAQRGHVTVVQRLLKAGADMDQLTNDLSCPLYAAVSGGHMDVVELLVGKGAEVNRTHTASCWTCLHQAVYMGNAAMVRVLAAVAELEALDDHRISPLFLACQYGRLDCLEVLVQAGANVNTQAADLATPLFISAQEGHLAAVDFLLGHGADANMVCSADWPQMAIHAAAEFGHCSVLRRLITATDRACDRDPSQVSPLYLAVNGRGCRALELLLDQGFSPDGQECVLLGLKSPLSYCLQTSSTPCSDSMRMLISAGARLREEDWAFAFSTGGAELLRLVLDQRRVPAGGAGPAAPLPGRKALDREEVQGLLRAAARRVKQASSWLPLVLRAGLDPHLLLLPHLLEEAPGDALNYLLEFVDRSALSAPVREVLGRRRAAGTWEPRLDFDSPPSLCHACRLQVRALLGPDVLMRTDAVRRLPLPACLQDFLQFSDVQDLVSGPAVT